MQSSFNKERQWVVSNPIATEGALHNMYSSDSDRDGGSDDTDEDEGFGVDHSPVHHQAQTSFRRSVGQNHRLCASDASDVLSTVSEMGAVSPERVHDKTPRSPSGGGQLVLSDIDTSHTSDVSLGSDLAASKTRPEDAPEALPGVRSFPTALLSDDSMLVDVQGNGEDPVQAPYCTASKRLCSPSTLPAQPLFPDNPTTAAASESSDKETTDAQDTAKELLQSTVPYKDEPVKLEQFQASARVEKRRSDEAEGSFERDLRLLTVTVAFMAGMAVPERFRWLILGGCFLTMILIIWRLAPTLQHSFDSSDGQWVSLLQSDRQTTEQSKVPLPRRSVDANGSLHSQVPLLRKGAWSDATTTLSAVNKASGDGRASFRAIERKMSESFKHLIEGRSPGSSFDVDNLAAPADSARDGELASGGGADREGTSGDVLTTGDLHRAVIESLSEEHRSFIASAGEVEKARLVKQCLAYANGELEQACVVCAKFCKFRTENGWTLLLSPTELEAPLMSRTHTLAESRDSTGRGILTFSPGNMDMTDCSAASYQKMLCYVLQEALKDEELQAKGLVLLVDARDVGFSMLAHFKMADYKRGLRMLSGAFPAKLKAIRILHPTGAVKVALSIALRLLSAKMRARLEVVSDDAASDGSFVKDLADPAVVPEELGIGGTWKDSVPFWESWIDDRVGKRGKDFVCDDTYSNASRDGTHPQGREEDGGTAQLVPIHRRNCGNRFNP